MSGWLKHEGGPNPAPGEDVDLVWGIGIVEGQPSGRVNWSFKWEWRPSSVRRTLPTGTEPVSGRAAGPVRAMSATDEHSSSIPQQPPEGR